MHPVARSILKALVHLNNLYGYGDVKSVRLFLDGTISFTVQGYGMRSKIRFGRFHNSTVYALRHQREAT